MGFTKALFFPTIDIDNEEWLKNAILFWDEIHTIVPSSISNPYRNDLSSFLHGEGILKPITVSSDNALMEELSIDTVNYLNTYEGSQLLRSGQNLSTIHQDKLPNEVRRLYRMHPEKLAYEIQYQLRENLSSDGWLNVDQNFAAFYMTLLANKIAEKNSLALLSDNSLAFNLSNLAKFDNPIFINEADNRLYHPEKFINVSQGLMTSLIIQGVKVSKNVSLKDIIKFKQKHRDELGQFRTNISKLTKDVPKDLPINAVKQQVEDIYNDEFLPAFNNFKKSMNSAGIKWTTENFMKVTFFSAPTTAIPLALLGLSSSQALLAGAGISLLTSLVSYNIDKQEKLRNNPYSYLLSVEKIQK